VNTNVPVVALVGTVNYCTVNCKSFELYRPHRHLAPIDVISNRPNVNASGAPTAAGYNNNNNNNIVDDGATKANKRNRQLPKAWHLSLSDRICVLRDYVL
jgi:hypothetical protein